MVCRIKNVPNHIRTRNIDEVLSLVMLEQHKNKCTKELSGGMKRKLSLGMALIG
jgi:ABC-type multidrug transport system ATPase subunit